MSHPVIDRNIDFIKSHLKTHTIFWIGKQIGVNRTTMHRYAKLYKWKGRNMREVLSIEWSPEDIGHLKREFRRQFNRQLAAHFGVSIRCLIRKARELKLTKEPGFLEKRRKIISQMAAQAHPPVSQGTIDRLTEAGRATRFKPGHAPVARDHKKIWETRRRNSEAQRSLLANPY